VPKSLLLGAALAASVLSASQIETAAAALSAPTGPTQGALVQEARWRCDPFRCWWVPGY
jgi:Ca2+/H+ antiporter